jgi:hypothetical protein
MPFHSPSLKLAFPIALLALLCPWPAPAAAPVGGAAGPKVLAFYYTWYGTPAVSGAWRHWDEGGHRPDHRTPAGLPDIGATDHPLELYDANDPAVIRRHLDEAVQTGIDVLLPTWWAPGDWHDKAFAAVLRQAEAGIRDGRRPVYLAPHYEEVPEGAADPVPAAADGFLYLLTTYGDSPAAFRHDGKPVIFVYSRAVGQLTPEQWREVLRRVKARKPAFVVGDSTDPAMYGVFDTLFEYNPVGAVVQGEAMGPRYARMVKDARSRGRVASLTVIPGYDDSHIGRANPTIAPREKGLLYQRLWNAALDAKPDWVLVCSYNEWHEGSEIEPSAEYGDLFLRLTRDYSDCLHTGQAVRLAPPGPDGEAVLPPGLDLAPVGNSRFAMEPLRGGGVLVRNRTGGPARLRARFQSGEEPYAFERGREGKLWRMIPPSSPIGAKEGFEYAAPTAAEVEFWAPEAFVAAHPNGPYTEVVRYRLHLDLSSESPGKEAQTWQVYPDGAFPVRATLRNAGNLTFTDGEVELWAPEGWGGGRKRLFSRLRPGKSASAVLTARPSTRAAIGKPAPAFVFVRLHPDVKGTPSGKDEYRISFQNSADFVPVRPVEARFTFGPGGETAVNLHSLVPRRTLNGSVTLRPAEGRTSVEKQRTFRTQGDARLPFHQRVPANEPPALRRTYATITIGGYRQLASAVDTATVALGVTSEESTGMEWVNWDDGRTEPVTGASGPARRAIPHQAGQPHYVYFNVTPGLPANGPTYVQVEYLDEGAGALRLQYDSTDETAPLAGRYKDAEEVRLTNTGAWKRHTWTLNDARFAGRQNGGADFRLALGPESITLRRVTVSKWP